MISCRAWVGLVLAALASGVVSTPSVAQTNPILFVTQVPVPDDFTSIGSTFGNHLSSVASAARGGDLMIVYPNGSLRYLTQEAGFGTSGFQGANSIAVRDPAVSDDGTKAVFSMVIGSPTIRFTPITTYWQLYEVTGLGQGQTATITLVPNQPQNYNNISPAYLPDGSIVFTSDRPRNGAALLYPQLDEYESAPTVSGVWQLKPNTGELKLLTPAPSGAFHPIVDSYGRVIFTRWDHLQRDQQADGDPSSVYNTATEQSTTPTGSITEFYPEPRIKVPGSNVEGLTFNQFFPWMLRGDGTGEETLNHIGRHELLSYFNLSFDNDANLVEFNPGARTNPNVVENMLQIREDPQSPGRYLAVDAPEFATHASGNIFAMVATPNTNPDNIVVQYVNDPEAGQVTSGSGPAPGHPGHFRDPLPLSNGQLIAAHTTESRADANEGTVNNPVSRYAFRLKRLTQNAAYYQAGLTLTTGISKSVSWFSPDEPVSFNGNLWELSPVEVRARAVPPTTAFALPALEQAAFELAGIDPTTLRNTLRNNGQALIVMRNTTSRDRADKQQPYNLRVPGGTQTLGATGTIYDISFMQFFQGDQVRGTVGRPGRRVLAQPQHEPACNIVGNGPPGSVPIAADGSVAWVVPADRPLTWQSTAPDGSPVVRERYWLSLRPGEVRVCDGCHGVNTTNQADQLAAANRSLALQSLLELCYGGHAIPDSIFANGFQ